VIPADAHREPVIEDYPSRVYRWSMSQQQIPDDVRAYLDSVEGARGESLRAVFDTALEAMPEGYELAISYGMPGWQVPLSRYPITYNKQPLAYVGLAAQKQYNSLYLMSCVSDSDKDIAFREAWAATGLKLNMGKSCLRFRSLADVDLEIIAETIAGTSVDDFIAEYEKVTRK